ncbi:endonuclease III [bacterium]|nr:endonuclease III [bacterium]
MQRPFPIEPVLQKISEYVEAFQLPSVTHIARDQHSPLYVLVSTILSSRTKDETTLVAAQRLFEHVGSARDLEALSEPELVRLIYPVGFYRTKARNLKKLGRILNERYGGLVPQNMAELLELPGVGRKTANLVLALAFDADAICVDTHVHRITNRWGYVATQTPAQTEMALRKKLPSRWWKEINTVLVSFGQQTCRPISPFCSTCPVSNVCPRKGVLRKR